VVKPAGIAYGVFICHKCRKNWYDYLLKVHLFIRNFPGMYIDWMEMYMWR